MAFRGDVVIDLDSHIVERADRFYDGLHRSRVPRHLPAALRRRSPSRPRPAHGYSLFGSRTSVVEPIETGRPLGVRDTFGLTRRSGMEGGRRAFPPGRPDALPPIRPEASWDVKVRVEDMDRAMVDVGVLYPTHVSSYCALRDADFENALYRAYHRWVADFCSQAPTPPHVDAGRQHARRGRRRGRAQPLGARPEPGRRLHLAPGAGRQAARPSRTSIRSTRSPRISTCRSSLTAARRGRPYGPGTFDLDGAWFLLHSFANPWAGMAALGALIGGGVFDTFRSLRVAIIETGGGWLPLAMPTGSTRTTSCRPTTCRT